MLEDLIHKLIDCHSVNELVERALKASHKLGFEHFAFGHQQYSLSEGKRIHLLNSYPKQWNKLYLDNQFVQVDPVVSYGARTSQPLLWSNVRHISKEFWEEARTFDLAIGWSKANHDHKGGASLVSISRSHNELTKAELKQTTPYLLWATSLFEHKYWQLHTTERTSKTLLTKREQEILKWSGIGKTVFEISVILGISERTVSFHLTNAAKKLNASNKTSSVAKAIVLGLIEL
ncbi:LuxR family transcriptional regulator [Vibrio ouci]|uniref:LuxR family transcriptional regulator n=1 Tax=Vibrio ouci TaxID=2499078 RepID=A0A4Y8WIU9_9VIBR|nr:LuxR family transcriptional regulator [Vibrio ouci]TFH92850.1 LuxR family transcriptional regulator [Vibrio ouci]